MGGFILIELRSKAPLLPLRIFRLRTLVAANVTMTLVGSVIFSEFFLLTLYLQDILHYSAVQSGAAFVAFALSVVVMSNVAQMIVGAVRDPRHADRGADRLGGVARLADAATGRRALLLGSLPGVRARRRGMGLAFVPITIASLQGVERADAGIASGLINTSRQIGGAIGLAAVSAIAAASTSSYADGHAGADGLESGRARPRLPDRALRADRGTGRRRAGRGLARQAGARSRRSRWKSFRPTSSRSTKRPRTIGSVAV